MFEKLITLTLHSLCCVTVTGLSSIAEICPLLKIIHEVFTWNFTLNVWLPMQRILRTKIHLTNQYPIKDNYVNLK